MKINKLTTAMLRSVDPVSAAIKDYCMAREFSNNDVLSSKVQLLHILGALHQDSYDLISRDLGELSEAAIAEKYWDPHPVAKLPEF